MEKQKEIALAVRAELQRRGIKVIDAARLLGVEPGGVSNYLQGRRAFGSNIAKKWSDTFGFAVPFLVSGDGPILKDGSGEQQDPGGVFIPERTMAFYESMAKAISTLSETIRELSKK